jgi:hypothetical protein
VTVTIKNLNEVIAGINQEGTLYEAAAGYAIGKMALEVERQAKKNAYTGRHKRGTPRIGGGGDGPNVVTGALRRSITTEIRLGFGHYVATVGPTMIYARQVELGGGKWKSGVKYPYLEPALQLLQRNGTLNRIFQTSMRSKLGG